MDIADSNGVELHYMTGTGNSHRIAVWVAEAAEARSARAALVAIGSERPAPVVAPMIGVLFPTHGFTAPWGVIRYVARMPRLEGRLAFVIAARAGWGWERLRLPGFEGTGSWLAALLLALKGANVVGITGMDMPSNWTALHPGMRLSNAVDIIERARVRTGTFADVVLGGGRLYRGWISLLFGVVLAPISLGYLLAGRLLLGKLFIADERCTSCGVCAKTCPFGAVRMIGRPARPYWTYSCESCMRCMNVCPEEAVQVWQPGLAGLLVLSAAVGVFVDATLALSGIAAGPAGVLAGQAASLILLIVVWAALYAGLWVASRWVPVAWLLGHTTFTRLYRRYHEPATDLRKV